MNNLPLAARFGVVHVAVAQAFSGRWVVACCSPEGRRWLVGSGGAFGPVLEMAKAYASNPGHILELPESEVTP
uniref:Uncharacterized protein n=1 Tax=viral metagenome TaxID=1070528 RepID=A0A6M3Y0J7_9ZZZZ